MQKTVTVIVGGFYGDEGKGRIVAAVAKKLNARLVARAGVGVNAGHSVVHEGKTYGIRQVPSAALDVPDAKLVVGPGVLVDPTITLKEVEMMGIEQGRLVIDHNCAIITAEHRERERADEHLMKVVGSTGSGCGTGWVDHVMRRGPIARDCEEIKHLVGNTTDLVHDALRRGDNVVIEGTQATFLSLYHGDYPMCTSKDVCASALCSDVGVGPCSVKDVVVVFKAYVTRVGNGYLEGELSMEETKARGWAEYGVVTGRPRRAAPFDMALARKAIALNSGTKIAICKVDVLFPECTGVRDPSGLSEACMQWIRNIEEQCQTPVYCIGTGPDAKDTVFFE